MAIKQSEHIKSISNGNSISSPIQHFSGQKMILHFRSSCQFSSTKGKAVYCRISISVLICYLLIQISRKWFRWFNICEVLRLKITSTLLLEQLCEILTKCYSNKSKNGFELRNVTQNCENALIGLTYRAHLVGTLQKPSQTHIVDTSFFFFFPIYFLKLDAIFGIFFKWLFTFWERETTRNSNIVPIPKKLLNYIP